MDRREQSNGNVVAKIGSARPGKQTVCPIADETADPLSHGHVRMERG
jgi:hypothetical protein